MSEPPAQPAPAIPLFLFSAIDLAVALFLLVDGGFTAHFALVFLIGLGLAVGGFLALRKNIPPE